MSERMARRIVGLWALACLLAFSVYVANAQTTSATQGGTWRDYAVLVGYVDQTVDLTWGAYYDPQPNYFVLEAHWLERDRRESWTLRANDGRLRAVRDTAKNWTSYVVNVSFPGPGHFLYRVKACNVAIPPNTQDACSDVVESTDAKHARVEGQPRGWLIFRMPRPLDPPIVFPTTVPKEA